jgi:hypothetical protein
MLHNNTISKLREMKLGTMAGLFQKQLDDRTVAELSFEDRFGMLVDAEWVTRVNRFFKNTFHKADYCAYFS